MEYIEKEKKKLKDVKIVLLYFPTLVKSGQDENL